MSDHQTKSSKYLLNQEHTTDLELDELYALVKELASDLEAFKAIDVRYRSLEEVNTVESESERIALNNEAFPILENIGRVVKEFQVIEKRVYNYIVKGQGALEEKVESES